MKTTEQIIEELKQVFDLDKFNFSFTCSMWLSGDGKKQLRQDIVKAITGKVESKSKCGLHYVVDVLSNKFIQHELF